MCAGYNKKKIQHMSRIHHKVNVSKLLTFWLCINVAFEIAIKVVYSAISYLLEYTSNVEMYNARYCKSNYGMDE